MSIEAMKQALDWFKCYRDKSMSRNNAEALAEEVENTLRQAIEQAEEKNCKNCVIDKPCIAKGKDMQICGAFVSKHAKELKQIALDKKAENARELGLDYEPVPWIESMTIDSTNEMSKPTAPVQEPVAWMYDWTTSEGEFIQDWTTSEAETLRDTEPTIISNVRPLYLHPAKWQSLTLEEHYDLADKAGCMSADWIDYARAIEKALKEKNSQ